MSWVATVTFGEVAGVTPPGIHCRGVAGVAYPPLYRAISLVEGKK